MSLGSVRKPRAADRLVLFHHSTLVTVRLLHTNRHRRTTDRHRSPQNSRQNTALHSLSLSSSYRAAADKACSCTAQRGQNCLSQLLALPRTVKVVAFSVSHREDGQCTADSSTMCLPHVLSHMCLPQYGVRVAMALPRDGNIAPPRWLLPTLPYSPPHANQRGVQLQCKNMEQQRGTP